MGAMLVVLITLISTHYNCVSLKNHNHNVYMGGGVPRGNMFPTLISYISTSNRGLFTSNVPLIIKTIEDIASENRFFVSSDKNFVRRLNGRWALLFTTDKETLFLLKNGLMGQPIKSICQEVDLTNNKINNLINLSNENSLSVIGSLNDKTTIKGRLNYDFKKVKYITPVLKMSFPSWGSGSFDNLYINNKYRLSKDTRGNYLVYQRCDI